jgi:leucyl-tRNA synthetase
MITQNNLKEDMSPYDHHQIEPKWQQIWEKELKFTAEDFSTKPKYYALVEFPYPSGEGLHLGHAFTNTILDIFVRRKRMAGNNVLYPMGWDAFGLPTENYAVKTGIQPAIVTKNNTDRFRQQMNKLALSYNWDREVNTTDPKYFKWTQWIFLKFFEKGLAYKAETPVGWCPSCKIILANEEIVDGKCERCGTQAEQRMQKQWLLKITAYADVLADELDLVDYPESAKLAQRNWIGRKEGIEITYDIESSDQKVTVFTTRPDTNFGATFIVLAPEHPLVSKITTGENKAAVNNYITETKKKTELERIAEGRKKTGVFTGSFAINRLTGKKMPIWVSDFVLMNFGTGAVVGVPGHDLRDFQFAKEFGIDVIRVVVGKDKDESVIQKAEQVQEDDGIMVNSDFLNGLDIHTATQKIMDYLEEKGWGKRKVTYHLRDWVFSRQHYWGEPIPVVDCPRCGLVPVPENELPLTLPAVEKYQPTETGESPLANISDWVNTKCPHCQGPAKRETDTMPNWAGSSWYYLRYIDPDNDQAFADRQKMDYWQPVDLYLGGAEHTTLHLLYSRFWHKFLNDLKLVPGREPYQRRRQHGMILAEDGTKMSKSKGNVINPDDMIEKYGCDTLRTYLAFMGPYTQTMPWSQSGIEGSRRFISRIWNIYHEPEKITAATSPNLVTLLNKTIRKVGSDLDNLKHNTAVAALMTFMNAWETAGNSLSREDAQKFILVIAPFAPHISEDIWQQFHGQQTGTFASIHQQSWPESEMIKDEEITIVILVNGKLRGKMIVANDESIKDQPQIEAKAKSDSRVQEHLGKAAIKKVIYVPGQVINFVTG